MNPINKTPTILQSILGQPCCRQRIGEWKSLHLGFGNKIYNDQKSAVPFYGEWELGTYSSNWEIFHHDQLLLSCKDLKSNMELDQLLQQIKFKPVKNIKVINDKDVLIIFKNSIKIYCYALKNDEATEVVHFFFPDHLYAEYHPQKAWNIEKSNKLI